MTIPFTRSMRSLKADSFRASLLGLLVAVILAVAWGSWFFLAKISVYETSQTASVDERGQVVAEFPPDVLGHVQGGQKAQLRLSASENGATTVQAIVTNVFDETREGRVRVVLLPVDSFHDAYLITPGAIEQVEIEVKKVSPATLVMQTSGQVANPIQSRHTPQDSSGFSLSR